jgi:V8-like Glu-specific endopeptidase
MSVRSWDASGGACRGGGAGRRLSLAGLGCLSIFAVLPVRAEASERVQDVAAVAVSRADRGEPIFRDGKPTQSLRIASAKRTKANDKKTATDADCPGIDKVVNGVETYHHPAVGQLLYQGAGPFEAWCTGTLIGCNLFLTAAHCFLNTGDLNPDHYRVYFQHAGLFDVAAQNGIHYPDGKTLNFTYDGSKQTADIAIVRLASPVTGIAPYPLASERPKNNACGRIVGFGMVGGANDGSGIKREGSVRLANCQSGLSQRNFVCWDFDGPTNPTPGTRSNTCKGDSGGPLLVGPLPVRVAGTTVDGKDLKCGATGIGANTKLTTDHSYDTNVATYMPWIGAIGGNAISTKACGAVETLPVDQTGRIATDSRVRAWRSGFPDPSGQQEIAKQIDVPPGTVEMRVGLNGESGPENDFDLLVYEGPLPGSGQPLCNRNDNSQFADCILPNVSSGPKTIVVKRNSGEGDYQVTVTFFPKK